MAGQERSKANALNALSEVEGHLKSRFIAASRLIGTRSWQAIQRELQIKKWSRAKKFALITGNTGLLRKLSQSRD